MDRGCARFDDCHSMFSLGGLQFTIDVGLGTFEASGFSQQTDLVLPIPSREAANSPNRGLAVFSGWMSPTSVRYVASSGSRSDWTTLNRHQCCPITSLCLPHGHAYVLLSAHLRFILILQSHLVVTIAQVMVALSAVFSSVVGGSQPRAVSKASV